MARPDFKAALLAAIQEGDVNKVTRLSRAMKVEKSRAHFMRKLVLESQNNAPSVELTVHDWKDIELFLKEPPTQEHNPGGDLYESILMDTIDAIEDKDAPRLLENLLLIYKAVRRG
jgi:hypothetical protein